MKACKNYITSSYTDFEAYIKREEESLSIVGILWPVFMVAGIVVLPIDFIKNKIRKHFRRFKILVMEDFIPYELAVKLKEKGFKEKCLTYYDVEDNVGLLFNTQYFDDMCPCQYTDLLQSHNTDATVAQPDDSEYCVDAPTISQVLKWLRKEKNIFVVTFINDDSDAPLTYEIYMGTECLLTHHGEYFTLQEWDKCNLAGIEYCLNNLI